MLYFASSNANKYYEIQSLIREKKSKAIKIEFKKMNIKEIQADNLMHVAEDKVLQAFNSIRENVIIEDDGLFIRTLNGFPGIYSSYVYKTIGNEGILNLLKNKKDRSSTFQSIISFYDGKEIKSFIGVSSGKITNDIVDAGWGFDSIFIPDGANLAYGQMSIFEKNKWSHRKIAFDKFYKWFENYQKI